MRGSSITQGSTGRRCAATDLRGSSITQGSTGRRCAATDLRDSSITQESTGGSCAADYCYGSCSCGSVTQCGMSQNEQNVCTSLLFQLLQVCFLVIRGRISYTLSVERIVSLTNVQSAAFCSKISGPISIMSCSLKKRYQGSPCVYILHWGVGKPGNEATLVVQVTNIEVRSSGYQARFSMCSL